MTTKRTLEIIEDTDGNVTLSVAERVPNLTGAAAALAGLGAGSVDNGAHAYLLSAVTDEGETGFEGGDLGALVVTVVDKAANGKVALSGLPIGSVYVTARKLYRTAAGADQSRAANYKLVASLGTGAMTYTDNIADAALGAAIPIGNTTANPILHYDGTTGVVTTGNS